MSTKTIILTLCVLSIIALSLAVGDCPLPSKVQSCSPKCTHDSECSAIGGKCCTNACHTKSCAKHNELSNSDSRGAFNKYGSATGTYCGNVKCNSYEKCEEKYGTKPKCVRA